MNNSLESPAVMRTAKADKRNRGELEHVHVEPAENGYMVTAHYEPKSTGKNAVYPDPEKTVHESHEAASAKVAALLKEHDGYEAKEK